MKKYDVELNLDDHDYTLDIDCYIKDNEVQWLEVFNARIYKDYTDWHGEECNKNDVVYLKQAVIEMIENEELEIAC